MHGSMFGSVGDIIVPSSYVQMVVHLVVFDCLQNTAQQPCGKVPILTM